jgi:hypothetical protein
MRELTDADRLRRFMQALGAEAESETRVYLTGGATAVLLGWRATTIDADIVMVPESDRLLRAIPRLKETLRMNVELASPAHFIPELPGWADRSPFITREGMASFFHYDLYAQALSKIERGHVQDRRDVSEMLRRGLVEPARLRELFGQIAPKLYLYPAIDPPSFRRAVEAALASPPG